MHCALGPGAKRLSFFERYLSLWVALCIVAGVAIGKGAPGLVALLSRLEVSRVNLPIAVLIWLMIYPMMLRIDFAALRGVGRRPKGLLIVLFVNWLVKPFSMAFLGWLFFKQLFGGLIGPELGDQYLAGAIILAAAPCTAMVFVQSTTVTEPHVLEPHGIAVLLRYEAGAERRAAVILLHGWTGSKERFQKTLSLDRPFVTASVDLPGHTISRPESAEVAAAQQELREDVNAWLRRCL